VNGEPALYDTRTAVLWDDDYLYVGFWVEEPYVQAKITERDEPIFSENNVEVFIDGGDTYYEFEINALNTIYEVFFIWKNAYRSEEHTSELQSRFDLVCRLLLEKKKIIIIY